MKGKVRTVLGDIEPAEVGMTSMHEHLFIDFTVVFQPPVEATAKARRTSRALAEHSGASGMIRSAALPTCCCSMRTRRSRRWGHFKRVGGGTIVDVTTIGIGRDPIGLANIARATGSDIVTGAGYYIAPLAPGRHGRRDGGRPHRRDGGGRHHGRRQHGIRAGIIGELGCGWPLHENERKVLLAAAAAQQGDGASILVHPGRDEQRRSRCWTFSRERERTWSASSWGTSAGRTRASSASSTSPRRDATSSTTSSGGSRRISRTA